MVFIRLLKLEKMDIGTQEVSFHFPNDILVGILWQLSMTFSTCLVSQVFLSEVLYFIKRLEYNEASLSIGGIIYKLLKKHPFEES